MKILNKKQGGIIEYMAERRMFTKKITDGDIFTSMPPTTQCLYFHLCMGADDDGFSNNIRIAMFNAHATTDDFNTLVNKRFIIPFESGVIVIKHWKMHNLVRCDRYHETKFLEEKAQLVLKDNGVYSLDTTGIPNGYQVDTEVRLGKDSIEIDKKKRISTKVDIPKEKEFSFDKHTNKENIIHLFETEKEYEKLKDSFKQTLIEWAEYKDECRPKKNNHFTESGLRKFIKQAINKASEVGMTRVTEQINIAIVNQWKGAGLERIEINGK